MDKNLIDASIGVACRVGSLSILDLSVGFPFAGYSRTLDITFLVSSAVLGYLSWDSYRENCGTAIAQFIARWKASGTTSSAPERSTL